MYQILHIALTDLRVYFKNPGAYIGLFVTPMMFAIFLGFGLGGTAPATRVRVDVLDADNSTQSTAFLDAARTANPALVLCPHDNDADDFCRLAGQSTLTAEQSLKRLTENVALAAIEIPVGFGAGVLAGDAPPIVYRSNENASAPSYIAQAINAAATRMGGALAAASTALQAADGTLTFAQPSDRDAFRQSVYDRAAQVWAGDPFSVAYQQAAVDPDAVVSAVQSGFGQSVPGMATMFVSFTVLMSGILLPLERKNWTLQRLIVMPLSRSQVIAGKVLMFFSLGMIQFVAIFGMSALLTRLLALINPDQFAPMYLGGDLLALLLVMVSFTLCMTAFGFVVASLVKTDMQGVAILNLVGLTLAPLGGAWWSLDIVPPIMRTIGHLSPIAWAMDGFQELLFRHGTLLTILPPISVLVVGAVVLFIVAVLRFKYD